MIDDLMKCDIITAVQADIVRALDDAPRIVAELKAAFPAATEGEIVLCMTEALEDVLTGLERLEVAKQTMTLFAPLFRDKPDDVSLIEHAARKASAGDALAISFLKFNEDQGRAQ